MSSELGHFLFRLQKMKYDDLIAMVVIFLVMWCSVALRNNNDNNLFFNLTFFSKIRANSDQLFTVKRQTENYYSYLSCYVVFGSTT